MIAALLQRQYGGGAWDGVLRLTGLTALAAIPLVYFVPASGGMVGFALVTIWVNGPISPVLPSTYEPILILFGRLYSPLLVATVGVAGTLYVEYLNYHICGRAVQLRAFEGMRKSRWVEHTVRLFRRAPFVTMLLCSFTPFPYWPVRFISPLAGYPIHRHLFATFVGRYPRLWLFASLGTWLNVSVTALVWLSLASILLALTIWLTRRWRMATSRRTTKVPRLDTVAVAKHD